MANEILTEVNRLQRNWAGRGTAWTRWYNLLKLENNLDQENMESFIGNDPRTTYNMAVYLLTPRPLVCKVITTDGVGLTLEESQAIKVIENYFALKWSLADQKETRRGRTGWFRNFIGTLLSTGWVSLAYHTNGGDVLFDYWHPNSVFPEYDTEIEHGLGKLGIKKEYPNRDAAYRRANAQGWDTSQFGSFPANGKIVEAQLWANDGAVVTHQVQMGRFVVKPKTVTTHPYIPWAVFATGGLPDRGQADSFYQEMQGQSILATNEYIYQNANRQATFAQQMIRDTANPRWLELSTTQILKPGDLFKRGAIFRGGPGDDVRPLAVPPIPVEQRQLSFDLRNMMQRGSFSDITFGNVLGEVTATLVSQASESAQQILTPFKDAITSATSQASDRWYQDMLEDSTVRPRDMEFPDSLKGRSKMVTSYTVRVPGDLANRAAMAKGLAPDFQFSVDLATETFFPEITDLGREQARVRSDKARRSEIFTLIDQANALDEAIARATRNNNARAVERFSSALAIIEAQLSGQQGQQQAGPQQGINPALMQQFQQSQLGGG
jgi:hypothetical protein